MSALPEQYLSMEDYFKLEETSDIKHEYYRGAIFAMTGASLNHNLVARAVVSNRYNQLDDKPCQAIPSDFRLKIEAVNIYTYPDILVICGDA